MLEFTPIAGKELQLTDEQLAAVVGGRREGRDCDDRGWGRRGDDCWGRGDEWGDRRRRDWGSSCNNGCSDGSPVVVLATATATAIA